MARSGARGVSTFTPPRGISGGDANVPANAVLGDVVLGASFDNNIICCDEKETFVVEKVFEKTMDSFVRNGAVLLRNHQVTRLERLILTPEKDHTVTKWVGKSAKEYLKQIDVPFQGDPRLIVCETGFDHPFVQHELLMPIMAVVRVKDVHEGIEQAIKAEHGYKHTAIMHSTNIRALTKMAQAVDTTLFIKNDLGRTGPRRFTTDVDDVRAFIHQSLRMRNCRVNRIELPAVRKRIRRHIDHAHD